jgi:hypothetical protein
MKSRIAWEGLAGSTAEAKLECLGIGNRLLIDVRRLDEISRVYGVEVILFFEPDLARNRDLLLVEAEFRDLPEFERPFIQVGSFLAFTRPNDPSFERTLEEFPMMIEIVRVGERDPDGNGWKRPYVVALMPYLDEFDVDRDLVAEANQMHKR